MVFSATRSLCRKLSKRYDVNVSYLFFSPPFPFLSLINLKLRGRIVPFDRAIHVHPFSRFLWQYPFASLAPLLDAISLDRNRGGIFRNKNWQELVLLAPFSRNAIHRAFPRLYPRIHASERSDKWGSNLCEKKFSIFPRCTFHSNQSIPRTWLILVHFFNRKVFRSKPI